MATQQERRFGSSVPGPFWVKFGIAAAVGLLVVSIAPRLAAGGDRPAFSTLLILGGLITLGMVLVLWITLQTDLKLGTRTLIYAVAFNAMIILVKFTFAPFGVYEVNKEVDITGFTNISDPFGAAVSAVLVFLLYSGVYTVIYVLQRNAVRRTLGLPEGPKRFKELQKKSMVGFIITLALLGGAALFTLLILALFGFEYLSFVFTSSASLAIALGLAFAASLATLAFKDAGQRSAVLGDATLIVGFFWVGLFFIALYHVLWVVYILVLSSIWPFKVVVPK